MDALVTTEWLAAELDAPDLRILDATWFLLAFTEADGTTKYRSACQTGIW